MLLFSIETAPVPLDAETYVGEKRESTSAKLHKYKLWKCTRGKRRLLHDILFIQQDSAGCHHQEI